MYQASPQGEGPGDEASLGPNPSTDFFFSIIFDENDIVPDEI